VLLRSLTTVIIPMIAIALLTNDCGRGWISYWIPCKFHPDVFKVKMPISYAVNTTRIYSMSSSNPINCSDIPQYCGAYARQSLGCVSPPITTSPGMHTTCNCECVTQLTVQNPISIALNKQLCSAGKFMCCICCMTENQQKKNQKNTVSADWYVPYHRWGRCMRTYMSLWGDILIQKQIVNIFLVFGSLAYRWIKFKYDFQSDIDTDGEYAMIATQLEYIFIFGPLIPLVSLLSIVLIHANHVCYLVFFTLFFFLCCVLFVSRVCVCLCVLYSLVTFSKEKFGTKLKLESIFLPINFTMILFVTQQIMVSSFWLFNNLSGAHVMIVVFCVVDLLIITRLIWLKIQKCKHKSQFDDPLLHTEMPKCLFLHFLFSFMVQLFLFV